MSENKFDASTGLTCISCHLVFANSEIQRDHYKTDWHRYNVKRQVADLPPLPEADFVKRLNLFNEEKNTKQTPLDNYCNICRKPFQSVKSYENHLNSRRHRERQVSSPTEHQNVEINKGAETLTNTSVQMSEPFMEDEDEDDDDSSGWRTASDDNEEMSDYDETEAIPDTSCLFCNAPSSSVVNNLSHMTRQHGFSIPDRQYCVDVDGLIKYLGMKIGCGYECIACGRNVNAFCNRDACQKHMRDKNHCTLNILGEMVMEYLDYYDYSELVANEDENEGYIDDGSFLTLPSGAKIGHRSLARYFRQSLKAEDASETASDRLRQKLISNGHIKALGWGESSRSLAVQRARDMKCLKRVFDTYRLKQGLKSNKLFKTRGRKDQQ